MAIGHFTGTQMSIHDQMRREHERMEYLRYQGIHHRDPYNIGRFVSQQEYDDNGGAGMVNNEPPKKAITKEQSLLLLL